MWYNLVDIQDHCKTVAFAKTAVTFAFASIHLYYRLYLVFFIAVYICANNCDNCMHVTIIMSSLCKWMRHFFAVQQWKKMCKQNSMWTSKFKYSSAAFCYRKCMIALTYIRADVWKFIVKVMQVAVYQAFGFWAIQLIQGCDNSTWPHCC